tara:strand:+ start:244 stop:1743 length:1500 start_codon:yes stop_codon:yes gene_type:complete
MAIKYLAGNRILGLNTDLESPTLGSTADATITGATLDTTNKKLGTGCLSLDGTNDYITAGSTSDFTFLHDGGKNTITFWLKKDTPESGDVREILGTADGTSNGCEVIYLDRSSSSETRKVKIEFTNASSQQIGIYYAQEFFPNDSNWHHYAIVTDLSNSYLKAYVDGVEKTADSSYPTFTGTPVSTAQQHVLNIGRRNSGTYYLDGDLDDMSFWDRNLSTTEITALYNSGTGALVSSLTDQSGIKAYYSFDSTITSSSSDSYESSSSTSIPTNSNTGRVTHDAGGTFTNFKMRTTMSFSYGSGNWNGSLAMYTSSEDKGLYQSGGVDRFIGAMFHRHNSGSTENEHGAHDEDVSLTGSCNKTTSGSSNPYNILDYGCSGGLVNGKNIELERDGNTCYYRRYDNGFSNSHTSENSWTVEDSGGTGMGDMRYFIIGGRWNGSISATASYRKFEWTVNLTKFPNVAPTYLITNVLNGSIFEESDSGKHKIWNSTTNTWTEII